MKKHTLIQALIAIAVLSTLNACSSSSGAGSPPPNTTTVVVPPSN